MSGIPVELRSLVSSNHAQSNPSVDGAHGATCELYKLLPIYFVCLDKKLMMVHFVTVSL